MLQNCKKLLKRYFGYSEFRQGQEQVIKSILLGKDTLSIMPTGAGKSICYQIPALVMDGVTIVISPLISLMKDQVDSLRESGINCTYINSSLDNLQIEERIFNALNGDYKLIYLAPERLESEVFCNRLTNLNISFIAVDEAHCVSQWGHDFRPSYTKIYSFINKLNKRPIIGAFTATATNMVKKDILNLLKLNSPNIFITSVDRKNLNFVVIKGENKDSYIEEYLEANKDKTGIIYTSTRKDADNLYNKIRKKGYKVGVYHAGLSDGERKKAQEDFSFDNIDLIVSTNAFGMGIDKSNVRFVIHYNIPKNMEAYYQEAGRAGRDGEDSDCILLFSPKDIQVQKYFIDESNLSMQRKNYEYNKLRAMIDYCYTSKCLRSYILEYFGEEALKDKCDNCSNCNDDRVESDITIEAQKIFSCIYRMKESFGVNMVADVLKGSKNQKVLSMNLDKLSTYGIIKNFTQKEVVALINKLIADEYLFTTDDKFPLVKLRGKAYKVLKGEENVFIKVNKVKRQKKEDSGLLQILKKLRKEISTKENIPPFMVFNDNTLRELSERMPTTKEELLNIKGIGERKASVYGDEFLDAILSFTSIEENLKTHIITYNLYKEGNTLDEICKKRGLSIVTVQSHLFKCIDCGMNVDLDDFINKDYESIIIDTIKTIGKDKLKPIKEALPDEVDYMCIKSVLYKYKDLF